MQKLQCLNISKQFLKGCFKGTLAHLAEHSYWRDSFKDQLEVSYKSHVYGLTVKEAEKGSQSKRYLDDLVKQ